MLKGYGKLGSQAITIPTLASSSHICSTQHEICALLHCFTCLRVDEIILTSTKGGGSPIHLPQLTQSVDAIVEVQALEITFHDFHHNYNQRPFSLV